LKKHLENREAYIHLVFTYLDYSLNYINEDKNEISKYESTVKLEDTINNLQIGKILPNFQIKIILEENLNQIQYYLSIREFINEINKEKCKILFFN